MTTTTATTTYNDASKIYRFAKKPQVRQASTTVGVVAEESEGEELPLTEIRVGHHNNKCGNTRTMTIRVSTEREREYV
jgi:hypothetical protein